MTTTAGRRCIARGLVTLSVAMSAPAAVCAQGVTGIVRDASAAPLPGVLLTILNGDGERIRGVLSDASGRFVIDVPMGRYRLRAERIGLRTETTEPFDLDTFNLRFVGVDMVDRAVEISGLVVDARVQACRMDPEQGLSIQRWWREIRTALDVSAVLQREQFARFRVEKFEREWDERLRRVIASNRRVEVSLSSRPFVSAEAAFLAEGGFVQGAVAGQRQYYAPDADVLLSDVFLSRHCFSLVDDDDREDQIGLRFEPNRDAGVVDIEGTLWVDTTSAELQDLEYRYAKEDEVDSESGGLVAFDYLASGAWIVSEWHIRMPKVARGPAEEPEYFLLGYVDVGGQVTPLSEPSDVDADGAVGAIRGVVFDEMRGAGLPDATVTILGSRYLATTDPSGEFVLTNVPVGRHDVTFFHPDTDAWGLGSPFVTVDVADGLTSDARLAIPRFREAALALCLGEGREAESVIVGHLLGPDREGLVDATIELAWTYRGTTDMAIPARTGSGGRFVVCSIPADVRVAVRAEVGGRWIDAFELLVPPRQVTYREVWITR